MKNKYLALGFVLASASVISLSSFKDGVKTSENKGHIIFSNSGPTAKTGAPGEGKCTDCHSGTVQVGTGINTLSFSGGDTFLPGETKMVTLAFSEASNKNGFQATVLNAADEFVGTIESADATTQTSSAMGRTYINHTASSNTGSSWSFNWTAPAVSTTEVTFYVATNKTNANGANSGDVIYNSTHTFMQDATSGIYSEVVEDSFFEVGYNSNENVLVLDFNTENVEEGFLNLVNMQGQSVLAQSIGEVYEGENSTNINLPLSIKPGVYVAHFFIGNNGASKKIYIQK